MNFIRKKLPSCYIRVSGLVTLGHAMLRNFVTATESLKILVSKMTFSLRLNQFDLRSNVENAGNGKRLFGRVTSQTD